MAYAELSYEKYLTYFKTLTSIELKKYEATEICKKSAVKSTHLKKITMLSAQAAFPAVNRFSKARSVIFSKSSGLL